MSRNVVLRLLAFTALSLIVALPASAQRRRLQGQITNESGEALKGVMIFVGTAPAPSEVVSAGTPDTPSVTFDDSAVIKELETDKKGRFTVVLFKNIDQIVMKFEKEGYRSRLATAPTPIGNTHREYVMQEAEEGAIQFVGKEGKAARAAFDAGVEFVTAGDWKGAKREFEKVVKLKPQLMEGWLNLATAEHNLGAFDKAVSAAKKALEIDPEQSTANMIVADALVRLGRGDEASTYQNKVASQDPRVGAEIAFNKGAELANSGHDQEARVQFEKAIAGRPDLADAYYAHGLCTFRLGDTAAAAKSLQKFVDDLVPEHEKAAMAQMLLKELAKAPQ